LIVLSLITLYAKSIACSVTQVHPPFRDVHGPDNPQP
jgi:hypothetical protein